MRLAVFLVLAGLLLIPGGVAEYYEECSPLRGAEICTEYGDWNEDGTYECESKFIRGEGVVLLFVGSCDGSTDCKAQVTSVSRDTVSVCYSNAEGNSGVFVLGIGVGT